MGKVLSAMFAAFGLCAAGAPAWADTATLFCPAKHCILTFQTNAGWEQRVQIRGLGSGFNVTRTGKGEEVVHFRTLVDEGIYEVTAWHKAPDSEWVPSAIKTVFEQGGHFARADDGGPPRKDSPVNDQDFNDAVVSMVPFEGE